MFIHSILLIENFMLIEIKENFYEVILHINHFIAQSAGAVEYTDRISAEIRPPPQ